MDTFRCALGVFAGLLLLLISPARSQNCEPAFSPDMAQTRLDGAPGQVFDMIEFDEGQGPRIIAGGLFRSAGSSYAMNVARSTPTLGWEPMGEGLRGFVRALEVFELTGRPLSDWQVERARPATVNPRYLLVDPGDVLGDRIGARVHQMIDAGWEREVEALSRDVPAAAPAWNACGYALLREALDGTLSRSAAIERTIIDTRQYAKRQRTWFRHQLPAARVMPLDPTTTDAVTRAVAWFASVSLSEHP
jgi:hypothetical protein